MATWNTENSLLTLVGEEILSKLKVGNGKITVTRIVAGSGRVDSSTLPEDLRKQTSVRGVVKDLTVNGYHIMEDGSEISFSATNKDMEESYTVYQIGVYVTHPDYEGEQLYHISQCEEEGADVIPADTGNVVTLGYSLYLTHGNSESVTIVADPEGMMSLDAFEAYKTEVGGIITRINANLASVNADFLKFKEGVLPNSYVSSNSDGDLITSGLKVVSGYPVTVTDSLLHRALSLSIEGKSTQASTPTVSAPVYLTNSNIESVRNKGGSASAKFISFPSIIELRSLGDYKDTIEWDGAKWWKVQRIQEVVLDGTTNGVYYAEGNSGAAYCRFCITSGTLYKIIKDHITSAPIITSHGNATHPKDTAEFYAFHYTTSKAICGHFLNTITGVNYSSQTPTERGATVNAWLKAQKDAGTPVKVYYVLSTPIVTEISLTTVLEMTANPTEMSCIFEGNAPNMRLGYALNTTDATIMYILKSLARKSEVQTANTFATVTKVED